MAERERAVLTVSQVNEYVRMLLDHTPVLGSVYVRGEISNFTNHYKSGHLYFTLKDADGLLKTVMFRSSACRLRFVPENGMSAVIYGYVSLYEKTGQYQLYAQIIEPYGIGSLAAAYEQLKRKLSQEGLFDEDFVYSSSSISPSVLSAFFLKFLLSSFLRIINSYARCISVRVNFSFRS